MAPSRRLLILTRHRWSTTSLVARSLSPLAVAPIRHATLATRTSSVSVATAAKPRAPSVPMGASPLRPFRVLDEVTDNKLSQYQLGKQIGAGNYAVVREAVDTKTKNRVAVKIMDKAKCGRSMCRNEVDVLFSVNKKVNHKRVTPVLDVFEDDTHLYIVLELLRGGELFDRVSERGRLPEKEVAQIVRKLAYALEALHRHGILHRDIKLENIVLDQEDDFKITDFGFATEAQHLQSAPAAAAPPPTPPASPQLRRDSFQNAPNSPTNKRPIQGKLAGTLGYCAPEVLREQLYTPACDVWSMGIITFILLAGYAPFPLADPAAHFATLEERIKAELDAIEFGRRPEEWRKQMLDEPWPSISPEAKALVAKMLTLDPAKRITLKAALQSPFLTRFTAEANTEFNDFE